MLNLNISTKTKPKLKPTLIFKNCSYVCVPITVHNCCTQHHRCKKRFYVFYSCHVFYVFNVFFIFPTFFKYKNVENLFSMQANS